MILQQTILILMLSVGCIPTMLRSEVHTEVSGNTISATTDKIGKNGSIGCQDDKLEEASAYIFRLEQLAGGSSPCGGSSSLSKWYVISEKRSKTGNVKFENLPSGKFKIISMVGEELGCLREDGAKSIVYAKETSAIIIVGDNDFDEENKLTLTQDRTEQLTVYPNPVRDQLTIKLQSKIIKGQVDIYLYSNTGQVLSRLKTAYKENTIGKWVMNVNDYSSGAYLIVLTDKSTGRKIHQKVIIQKN